MLWFFKKNVFSIKSMVTVEYGLERFPKEHISYPIVIDGMKFIARRLNEIDPEYEKRIESVLHDMDFRQPFDIEEARLRLNKGYYFIVLEKENEIIGWSWAAVRKIFFDEFNFELNLKEKHAFSFNTYIQKDFRGKRLNHIVLNEKLYQLKKNGYSKVWALIYRSNGASMKSYRDNGWKEIGDYKFLKLLFLNFRFPPKGI